MTRLIWLASYPKSGNTWFRLLVANLSGNTDGPVDINRLADRDTIASAREPFDSFLLIESGQLSHDEADALRPRVYEELLRRERSVASAEPVRAVQFVKVHDAYTLTGKGEPLLAGARGADGAIVIVRDPRDVVPSLASHLGVNIDAAVSFLNDADSSFSGRYDRQHRQLRQKMPGWSGHVATWLDQADIPFCLVRYEDLMSATASTVRKALQFVGHTASNEDIDRAVAAADFAQLQAQERKRGFHEAQRPGRGAMFFRRGRVGSWRDELTTDQVRRIEEAHGQIMLRLGYSPAYATARAAGGAR